MAITGALAGTVAERQPVGRDLPSCGIQVGYDDSRNRSDDFYRGWRARWIFDGRP